MIKYFYAYFNKLGDFFGAPFCVDYSKDQIADVLRQTMFSAKKEELENLKEDDLYYLGYFDIEKGDLIPEKDFITSMSGISLEILSKRFGVSEDVKA